LAGVFPLDLEVIRAAANWHVNRGLEFQFENLRVQRIPPDCPDDMRLHLASLKRKAVKQWLMTTWKTRWYSSEKSRTTFSWILRVRLAVSSGCVLTRTISHPELSCGVDQEENLRRQQESIEGD
jgi:hypothetical protein